MEASLFPLTIIIQGSMGGAPHSLSRDGILSHYPSPIEPYLSGVGGWCSAIFQADPTYYEWTRKSSSFSGPITFLLFLIIQGNRFNHTLTVQPGEWSNAPLSHMIIADMPHLYLTGEYGIQLLPVAAGHRTNWSVFVRDKTNRWMGIRRDR